jgi:hypothetical protein
MEIIRVKKDPVQLSSDLHSDSRLPGTGYTHENYRLRMIHLNTEFRSSGVQEFRSSGVQEFRSSGVQEFRSSGVQVDKFAPKNELEKSRSLLKNF